MIALIALILGIALINAQNGFPYPYCDQGKPCGCRCLPDGATR